MTNICQQGVARPLLENFLKMRPSAVCCFLRFVLSVLTISDNSFRRSLGISSQTTVSNLAVLELFRELAVNLT